MVGSIKEPFLKALAPAVLQPKLKAFYAQITQAKQGYECPFCHAQQDTFLPFGCDFPVLRENQVIGGGFRENAMCPNCYSLDRERLLYLYLLHKTNLFQKTPKKLLHVAPEPRLEPVLRAQTHLDYTTADIAAEHVMVKMDITEIPFPDATLDAIICNHVLEHIPDDARAMSELYRTLKPGGWAILQVPISFLLTETYEDLSITAAEDRERAFGQADHVRIYAKDYKQRLEQAGFQVSVFRWVKHPGKFGGRQNRFALSKAEPVYFVRKREAR